jgi:hypothetical protein
MTIKFRNKTNQTTTRASGPKIQGDAVLAAVSNGLFGGQAGRFAEMQILADALYSATRIGNALAA